MQFINSLFDKFFKIDFWNVFLIKDSFENFLLTKGKNLKNAEKIFSTKNNFFADPFILKVSNKYVTFLVEDFSFFKGGRVSKIKYNLTNRTVNKKFLLKGKHFSYPYIYNHKKKKYIFPEMSEDNQNLMFELKYNKNIIPIKNYLFGDNIVDPTIIHFKNKFWLFCGVKGQNENKNLNLFYSDSLMGNWISHPQNPVLKNKNFTRPAGTIIIHKNKIYRPSQDSKEGYGSRLYMNEISMLTENKYKEKVLFKISPTNKNYNGIHHLSYKDNCISFDQKYERYTINKILYYFLKKFYFKHFIN